MQSFRGILALSACLGLMQVPTAVAAEFVGLNLRPAQLAPAYKYQGLELESPGGSQPGGRSGQSSSNGDISTTSFELSQDDIVLYYQLPGRQIDVDLGVDLKRFAGEISSTGPDATTRAPTFRWSTTSGGARRLPMTSQPPPCVRSRPVSPACCT